MPWGSNSFPQGLKPDRQQLQKNAVSFKVVENSLGTTDLGKGTSSLVPRSSENTIGLQPLRKGIAAPRHKPLQPR